MLPLTVPVSCAGGGVTLGASATKLRVFVESVKLVPVLPPPPPPPPQAASNRQADTAYGCRTIAAKGCMAESPSKRGSATKPPSLVFQLTSTHIKLRRGNRRPEPSLLAGPSRNVDALQMRILCSERIGLAIVAGPCERMVFGPCRWSAPGSSSRSCSSRSSRHMLRRYCPPTSNSACVI